MNAPEHIVMRIRQRLGLEENDVSRDSEIEVMSPHRKLREVIAWELGDPDWADVVLQWARDCGFTVALIEDERE